MFIFLAYLIASLTICSCQTNTPTDPNKPDDISGIFFRHFWKHLGNYTDVPLEKGSDIINNTLFDKNIWTVFYVQSWDENANSAAPRAIMEALLKYTPANAIVFDWSSINTNSRYASVTGEVEEVGTAFGKQLCELHKAGLDLEYTELVGFQLGAHVAGQAGRTMKELCQRSLRGIVALDAAVSLFYFPLPLYRPMDKDDAQYTSAIHTSGLQNGVYRRIAKADIYVNKGRAPQPGCEEEGFFGNYCNTNMSWQLFAVAIAESKLFRITRADSYHEFAEQSCEENDKKERVYLTSKELEGVFYLSTTGKPPYGKGDKGICVQQEKDEGA